MTLPTDIFFQKPEDFENDPKKFLNDFIFQLQSMYEQIAQNVNGTIRNYADVDSSEWIPTLAGTSSAGSFTYVNQYGWVLRQGIMTDVFFDVSWSASTATGSLYLELPYIVTKSAGKPFVGPIQSSTLNYGAGFTVLNCNAIPSSYHLEIWKSGTTVATSRLAVPSVGQILGHCRYIGVSDE